MTPLETERLVIRNWEDRDRDLFHEINSDDEVMRFFPFRRTREMADAFLDHLRGEIAQDTFGFAALELKETGETIGFAGLHRTDLEPIFPSGEIEIGWRLARRFWSKGYASEAASALLRHGFAAMGLERIVCYAVRDNHRSTAVMRRIGMRRVPERDFDHPGVPETHPELKRHVVYVLTKVEWLTQRRTKVAEDQ